jgi:hypothetical protein
LIARANIQGLEIAKSDEVAAWYLFNFATMKS